MCVCFRLHPHYRRFSYSFGQLRGDFFTFPSINFVFSKGNGASCLERNGFLPKAFSFIRSYKESALGFFKGFISAVEQSNPGFKWDFDERKLVGKTIGVVLGDEEYRKKDGSIGTRPVFDKVRSAETIRGGHFDIPPLKKLAEDAPAAPVWSAVTDDDSDGLPF